MVSGFCQLTQGHQVVRVFLLSSRASGTSPHIPNCPRVTPASACDLEGRLPGPGFRCVALACHRRSFGRRGPGAQRAAERCRGAAVSPCWNVRNSVCGVGVGHTGPSFGHRRGNTWTHTTVCFNGFCIPNLKLGIFFNWKLC